MRSAEEIKIVIEKIISVLYESTIKINITGSSSSNRIIEIKVRRKKEEEKPYEE